MKHTIHAFLFLIVASSTLGQAIPAPTVTPTPVPTETPVPELDTSGTETVNAEEVESDVAPKAERISQAQVYNLFIQLGEAKARMESARLEAMKAQKIFNETRQYFDAISKAIEQNVPGIEFKQ